MSAPTFIYPPASTGGTPVGGSGTPDTIPRWATGTTLGNSAITDSGTAVAITGRSTTISAAFASATPQLLVRDTAGGNGALWLSSNHSTQGCTVRSGPVTGGYGFMTLDAFSITFSDSGTPRMTLAAGGNVGIGTASPSASHRVDAFSTGSGTDGSGQYRAIYTGGRGTNFGGSIGFGGYFTGTTPTVFAFITGGKDNATDGDFGGHLDFYTRPNGGSYTRAVTIDSAFNLALNTANTGATIQAAGSQQGLKLPATPGNADANTLDAYRDGGAGSGGVAFTATLKGSTSDPTTPVTATGQYVLVGKMLVMTIAFNNVNTTGAAGDVFITTNLPSSLNPSMSAVGSVLLNDAATWTGSPFANMNAAATIYIYTNQSNSTAGAPAHKAGAGKTIVVTISYIIA